MCIYPTQHVAGWDLVGSAIPHNKGHFVRARRRKTAEVQGIDELKVRAMKLHYVWTMVWFRRPRHLNLNGFFDTEGGGKVDFEVKVVSSAVPASET